MKISANTLRWLTLGALLGMILAVCYLQSAETWSDELKERASREPLKKPVMIAELAQNQAEFVKVFGDPMDATDTTALEKSLNRDYFFIATYTGLLVLLGLWSWSLRRRSVLALVLVILPCVVGLCDVMENAGIFRTMDHLKANTLTDDMIKTTRWWSLAKWALFFLDLLLIGWSLIGAEPWKGSKLPVILRRGTAGLLMVAAVTDFVSLYCPTMLQIGLACGLGALILLLMMLIFFPDTRWKGDGEPH